MTIEFGQGPATQGQLGKGNHASVERTKHEIKARGHSQTGEVTTAMSQLS